MCNCNLADGEKNENTLLLSIQTAYEGGHTFILSTLCSAGGVKGFHFQAVGVHQEFSSACVHVWVCPRVCLSIFWPAQSVMPDLISYTANVRESLKHLVTLLSRENFKPPASCCIAVGLQSCQTMRVCWFQQAEINDLMLRLTLNKG